MAVAVTGTPNVQSAATSAGNKTLTYPSDTYGADEVIVVECVAQWSTSGGTGVMNAPSGGGLTWTLIVGNVAAGRGASAWWAATGAGGTFSVTQTTTTVGTNLGCRGVLYRNTGANTAAPVGATDTHLGASDPLVGNTSLQLTTASAGSMLFAAGTDWNAQTTVTLGFDSALADTEDINTLEAGAAHFCAMRTTSALGADDSDVRAEMDASGAGGDWAAIFFEIEQAAAAAVAVTVAAPRRLLVRGMRGPGRLMPWLDQALSPWLGTGDAPAADGGTTTVGQATETDEAQPVTASKAATVGQAVETDSALPVAVSKALQVGQPAETDQAQPITLSKAATAGQATESDQALPLAASKAATVGQSSETDSGLPLTVSKAVTLGEPVESDQALPVTVTKTITLGIAIETDSALPVTTSGPTAVGQALETDVALPLAITKTITLGIAVETDSAQTLALAKAATVGQAVETDLAQPVTATKAAVSLGLAVETDTALPLSASKLRTLGVATETDVAQAVSAAKALSLALAVETDVALALVLLATFVPTLARTRVVAAQQRVATVDGDARLVVVASQPRVATLDAESRLATVAAQRRVATVEE